MQGLQLSRSSLAARGWRAAGWRTPGPGPSASSRPQTPHPLCPCPPSPRPSSECPPQRTAQRLLLSVKPGSPLVPPTGSAISLEGQTPSVIRKFTEAGRGHGEGSEETETLLHRRTRAGIRRRRLTRTSRPRPSPRCPQMGHSPHGASSPTADARGAGPGPVATPTKGRGTCPPRGRVLHEGQRSSPDVHLSPCSQPPAPARARWGCGRCAGAE